MAVTVMRSQYKGWYIEAIFEPEIQKWTAYFFDQYEKRIVCLSGSMHEVFDTPEEALTFAQSQVDSRIKQEEITERFSTLIDELLAKGCTPSTILWSLGDAIHKKRNELGINTEKLQDHLCEAATQAPGWR